MSVSRSDDKSFTDTSRSTSALLALGQICLNNGDSDKAFSFFESAARGGSSEAINMVGRAYERGWGVRRNATLAARYFAAAAEAGSGWAMFNLADLHLRGDGVEKNVVFSYTLYVEAARNGVPKALNMLGLLHEEGVVGVPDTEGAWAFFRAAAEAGDCWGFLNLARLYLENDDIGNAAFWFRKSLACGFEDAVRAVKNLLDGKAAHPLLLSVLVEAERRLQGFEKT